MIKKLLVPVILAIVVSLAGSAGFTVMKARTMHAEYLLVQDSLAVVAMDSATQADSAHGDDGHGDSSADHPEGGVVDDGHADDTGSDHGMDDPQPRPLAEATTPADSIRALIAEREARAAASTKPTPKSQNATTARPQTTPQEPPATDDPTSHDGPANHGDSPTAAADPTTVAPALPKPVTKPLENVLPERRLAKIFSAMSARDAAKVLAQMTDGDIRTILSMMGDRQAAAVLSALPAERAAAVSKGRIPPMESVTP